MSLQADLLIHAANLFYLCAFMVRDILWLRVLTVVASGCLVPYFYFQPEPLMTPIYWNLVFTALNVGWIARLLLERRPVKLSQEEERLCELVFRTMTPREMIKLLKLGLWQTAAAGECFVAQGTPLDRLMVIYSVGPASRPTATPWPSCSPGSSSAASATSPRRPRPPTSCRSSRRAITLGPRRSSRILWPRTRSCTAPCKGPSR